jgi:PII-like signaling protein
MGRRSIKPSCIAAKELKIAGAALFRGIEGFGQLGGNPRHHAMRKDQPIIVTIVDAAENLDRLIPELEDITGTG